MNSYKAHNKTLVHHAIICEHIIAWKDVRKMPAVNIRLKLISKTF